MEIKTLLKSNLKSHRGTLFGVLILILLISLSLGTVLTVWNNSSRYVDSEMDRLGYGGYHRLDIRAIGSNSFSGVNFRLGRGGICRGAVPDFLRI